MKNLQKALGITKNIQTEFDAACEEVMLKYPKPFASDIISFTKSLMQLKETDNENDINMQDESDLFQNEDEINVIELDPDLDNYLKDFNCTADLLRKYIEMDKTRFFVPEYNTLLKLKMICDEHGIKTPDISDLHEYADKLNMNDIGYIKFGIPSQHDIYSLEGESVWGYLDTEDIEKWKDDNYHGKVNAILCNDPFNYYSHLKNGMRVVLKCHGNLRPTLDPDWVKENILK